MNTKHTVKMQFGHRKSTTQNPRPSEHTANITLLCGVLTAGIFFLGSLTEASLSGDAQRVASVCDSAAVPVMSFVTESSGEENGGDAVREFLRKSIRDTSAEPFGYMNGRWNLWEYLGDVMADLLIGG